MHYNNKHITVMGLGILGGGIGTAQWFANHGARVTVTDMKHEGDLSESLDKLAAYDIRYVLGRHDENDFTTADMVIRNPAVPADSRYLQIARDHGVPVEMAESLFLKIASERNIHNIIGVTGTRGKSTTTQMIYDILKHAGENVFIAGNVKDTSTLSLLDNPELNEASYVVLELSSWQLESFGWHELSPHVAVMTNLYPDHLNRYASIDDYARAKAHIFLYQKQGDHLIINNQAQENRVIGELVDKIPATVHVVPADNFPDISISLSGGQTGGHNWHNANAAYEVCGTLGVEESVIIKTLKNFHGLPGRLEHLGEIDGRVVINDTASTTPIAGITAIESIEHDKNITLIIGGNSKNLPTNELFDLINKRVKTVVLLDGDALDILRSALSDKHLIGPFDSMDETFQMAYKETGNGDVILFSPSFTSFARFKNEFDRGDSFVHAYHRAKTSSS